jgi:4-hydroxy-2-oxoheptanedioate aldolase
VRPSTVRRLLAEGRTAVGGWLATGSPYVAECLSHAGYDVVTIDLQHGMFGPDAVLPLLQAVSAGPAEPWLRVPSLDPAAIGKALDAGAYGIICPSVDTPAQAEAFVAAMRYPPRGRRSYGPARAALYGGADYLARADDVVMSWAMIESAAALDAVERIAGTPGLDGLYVGPNDLAMSLGVEAGVPTPELEKAWRRILDAAHGAGIAAGTFCMDADIARRLAGLGYDLVTPMNDVMMLRAAAAAAVATARGEDPAGRPGGY